jgi:hypothetical protein
VTNAQGSSVGASECPRTPANGWGCAMNAPWKSVVAS